MQIAEDLGGERNAQRILRRMERDRSIACTRRECKVYYLSNRGKERIGSNQSKLGRNKIRHTLLRNDLYIKLGMPDNWETEVPINIGGETILIADAMYEKDGRYIFVEIDNVQTMRTNYDKIKRYKELSTTFFKQRGQHLSLAWYSLSDVRKKKLRAACEKSQIKYEIY